MTSNIDQSFLLILRESVGQQIREFRKIKGLTTQQLGEQMGVDRATLSKIEAGKWNFGIDTLNTIALFLDFKVELSEKN